MNWNCARVMPWCSRRYCGMRWYLWKAVSQSACVSGGMAPITGSHSVMESPEPVSRVRPPITTMAAIISATRISHHQIARREHRKGADCGGAMATIGPADIGCGGGASMRLEWQLKSPHARAVREGCSMKLLRLAAGL